MFNESEKQAFNNQAVAMANRVVENVEYNRMIEDRGQQNLINNIPGSQHMSLINNINAGNWDEIVAVSQDKACLGKFTNLAGAVAGVVASVAIELTREGGSVVTAGTAAGVGAGLIFANREAIMSFQNGPASVVGGLGLLGLTQVAARIAGAVTPNKSEEAQEYIG